MNKGMLAAVIAPFFIALSIIISKKAGALVSPLVIAGLGPLFSVPMLLLLNPRASKPKLVRAFFKESWKPFLQILMTRSVAGQLLIISGFVLTSGIKAVLLLRLEPLFVMLWSALLRKERPSKPKLMALAALLVGAVLVVAPSGPQSGPNLGDALIVASLLFFSYSYLPTEEVVKRSEPAILNIAGNLLGGSFLSLFALCVLGKSSFYMSQSAFQLILGYSFIFFAVACSLYFYAFKTLKAWVIASFLSLEVVFGMVLAYFLLGERMAAPQVGGAVIVLAATFWISRLEKIVSAST